MTSALESLIRETVGAPRGGVSVGAFAHGEDAYVGFGTTRPGGGRPVDADTLFEIGSISKVFTGALLACLALDGTVRLEDPLSAHLPGQHLRVDPTLRELAVHASGLPNTPAGFGLRELAFAAGLPGARDPYVGLTSRRLAAAVARTPARRRRFRYSSLGVSLLGDALAAASGHSYETLLRERLLDPLTMRDTAVHARSLARLAAGGSRGGRPREPFGDRALVPAGGIRSSARDMISFLRANLEPDGALGEALALARRPHARVSRRMAVGLCWLIDRRGSALVHWHTGGTWGFRSFAALNVGAGTAVVALSNRQRGVERAALRLLDRL